MADYLQNLPQNTLLRRGRRACRALLVLLLCGAGALEGRAQTPTPGLVFKPATAGTPGSAVLDPNNDGYVSATPAGFTAAAGDLGAQSEIPYKYLPQRTTLEPNADLRVGPSNKFTDFADVPGGGNSVGFYVDANGNYLFRFRLGGAAPNSKGYSIAIDTDNKFGFGGPNADPNAVPGNPGFEMEILLATNFGVRLYNIDGTISPNGSGPDGSLIQLPYASYAQKAVAATTNDNNLDVFYDFYVPISVIQSAFGSRTFFNSSGSTAVPFSLNTSLRMVANTIIAPHSVTHYQNISDISGVNDADYGNPDNAFTDLIGGFTPTSGAAVPTTSGNAIPARTPAPVVSGPLQTNATAVSGTSGEAAGTVITVYVNGTALGTTTTVQADGTWTLTGIAPLANGALVKATATAPGKSVSDFSNEVQAGGSPACATAAPSIACSSDRGLNGTAAPGAMVYLRYPSGALVGLNDGQKALLANPVTADNTGFYIFTTGGGNISCGNGQPNALKGSYLVSQVASGTGCESAATTACINSTTTATPVVTTPRPITPATSTLAGMAASGATVTLFVDGSRYSSVPATGGNFSFSGASLPALTSGRILTVSAVLNATTCVSGEVTLNVVAPRTVVAPVVNSPLYAGSTTVSGTSAEAPGSVITVTTYAAGTGTGAPTATYTATVQADGSWTVTVSALVANSSVKATVTPTDYSTSGFSNLAAVQTRTNSIPVITGSYAERGTAVTGTSAAPAGSIITVYEDGYPLVDPITGNILTTTVQTGGGWSLSGLSAAATATAPALYAGGVLTATATATGQAPSAFSNAVTVGCATLAGNSLAATAICQNNSATFTVANAEQGIVYTLQDGGNGSVGSSKVGNGGSLTFTTPVYGTAGTYPLTLNTLSIGAVNCGQNSGPANLTVNPLPAARTLAAQNATIGTYQVGKAGTDIIVQSAQTGVSYQLINTSVTPNANVGAPQNGTGGNLRLPTGPISTATSSTTYAVRGTNTTTGCAQAVGTQAVAYAGPLPVELTDFTATAADQTDAALQWHTASEKNNDRFEVERSADGQEFAAIGEVKGNGSSGQAHTYRFRDAGAIRAGAVLYYRLRQIDQDGTASNSPIRMVTFAKPNAQLLLYPNPATATAVTCSLALLPAGTYDVSVRSTTGSLLRAFRLDGGQVQEISLATLPTGLYLVQVQGAGISLVQRLVKLQ